MYIFSIGGGCYGWLNKDKENEDARNPSLYAKGYCPIRIMCKTYFKL